MSDVLSLKGNVKSKLGLNVFKESSEFHIEIKTDKTNDKRLFACVRLCPAELYSADEQGCVVLSTDGCLECGTCLIICGDEVLSWNYPQGATGVQYRFG
ncbi:MAG: 4Fe-4S dicluster domain-containing protein [Coriobacteriia bacterium]|nr:4Fe-4S dicluster domain-containing protein [Coriobacteriia bacterium]MCL2749824.1 4Fe-4S dicluster domain-containing protein [Coriobacteriia bacterium]